MTSREYFESIREVSQRYQSVLYRIRQRRELNGSFGNTGNITGVAHAISTDAMTFAVANIVENEPRDLAELKELRMQIDEAMRILKNIGIQYGALRPRLLYWRYIRNISLSKTGQKCGIPKSTVFTLIRSTFDSIDRGAGLASFKEPEPRQPPELRRPRTKHTPGAEIRKHQVNTYKLQAI